MATSSPNASSVAPDGKTIRTSAPRRRVWQRIAGGLIALYLVSVLVLVLGQERLAFPGWSFPKRGQGAPPKTTVEEFTVLTPDGNRIQTWWLPPKDWTPEHGALLYLHGNGENLSDCGRTLTKWRNELNTGVLAFDYPGYGHSSGRPTEESCAHAAQACFDWLVREKKVPAHEIVVVGQSLGAGIAVELVQRRPCRMLITSGAFTSFPDIAQYHYFWMPARSLVHLQFDNLRRISTIQTPIFLVHGSEDHTVPFSHGERLFAAIPHSAKRFLPLPGHGHSHPKSAAFYDAVRQFLRETDSLPSAK